MSDSENNDTADPNAGRPRDLIQVSSLRFPTFYARLALRFFQEEEKIQFTGLGNAISTAVSVVEILKKQDVATVDRIETSSVEVADRDGGPDSVRKAKISISMVRREDAVELLAQKLQAMGQRGGKVE